MTGQKIKAIGYAMLTVQLGDLDCRMRHKFILNSKSNEDVILGLDFLGQHGLIIDTRARTLLLPTKQEICCNSLAVKQKFDP